MCNDRPTKILQQFSEIFTDFLYNNFNSCLESGIFPDELKSADVVQVYKRMIKRIKVIIDPSVFFRIYQKFTKDVSKRNYMNILLIFYQNSNVAFDRDSVLNFVFW